MDVASPVHEAIAAAVELNDDVVVTVGTGVAARATADQDDAARV
jgi:hypothetical protein